jgi:hypothetical protein
MPLMKGRGSGESWPVERVFHRAVAQEDRESMRASAWRRAGRGASPERA